MKAIYKAAAVVLAGIAGMFATALMVVLVVRFAVLVGGGQWSDGIAISAAIMAGLVSGFGGIAAAIVAEDAIP